MSELQRRRTKIVATVGPASREVETLVELIEAGADVFRLNFSHGTAEEHVENIERIREASERTGKWVGILGDLPGPKIRLGEVGEGRARLNTGHEVTLTTEETDGDSERLAVAFDGLPDAVEKGDPIYLADGRVQLRAIEVGDGEIKCEVVAGGTVASHQGVNLPGSESGLPAAGEDDLDWCDFAVEHEVDLLAVSFVRSVADLEPVQERIDALDSDIPLIAKIEKPRAAEHAGEIIDFCTSGIMVARGDLGIELPIEEVPATQKMLIREAGLRAKPSITATQMLASMVESDRPTRAEVTDIANAIHDGTDAIMLSEETAVGEHPAEAIRTMVRVARETERDLPYEDWLRERMGISATDVAAAVAQSAVATTYRLGLAAIIVPTRSGRTARLVSSCRPRVPVLAISPRKETVRRMNLLFGVSCVLHENWEHLHEMLGACAEIARREGFADEGDLVAVTAGLPSAKLGTNLFEVHRV